MLYLTTYSVVEKGLQVHFPSTGIIKALPSSMNSYEDSLAKYFIHSTEQSSVLYTLEAEILYRVQRYIILFAHRECIKQRFSWPFLLKPSCFRILQRQV